MDGYKEGVRDNNAVNGGEIVDAEVAKTNSHSERRSDAVRSTIDLGKQKEQQDKTLS